MRLLFRRAESAARGYLLTGDQSFMAEYRQSLEAANFKGSVNLACWTSVCQTLFASGEFRYVY